MTAAGDNGRPGRPERLGARDLVHLVLDDGTFTEWVDDIPDPPADATYAAALQAARARTGMTESVLTGHGTLHGRRVAVVAGEFRFLAGSIGVAAAERLVLAVERATRERLPLLAATASGGTRMQEGTVAFLQMVKITAALAAHKAAGLPYLVYLRHPTTGGVFASWGSLGHVTVAEPGALIGFLGPRVHEALHGVPFPDGVQVAEHLFACGLVDAVLPPDQLPAIAARALRVLAGTQGTAGDEGAGVTDARPAPVEDRATPADAPVPGTAWDSVVRSRRPDRPGVRSLLRIAGADVLPLNGTGAGEAHPGLLLALARFGDEPCVLLAQDLPRQVQTRLLGPEALRQARRGMSLARDLSLPLVTVIDTPGAALTVQAEEGGLAGEIARSLADLVTLPSPTLAVLLGQGSGGGALALAPGDRVVAAQHAWLSPLPPEGASAILHRSADQAPRLAQRQGIDAWSLHQVGIVDRIVAERPDAADEPDAFCRRLGAVLAEELATLRRSDPATRMTARRERYRRLGLIRSTQGAAAPPPAGQPDR
jgi:acetyl-CoA carboxylase carboxyl transferase subunit beta